MELPSLAICSDKYINGIRSLEDTKRAEFFKQVTLRQALETSYKTDAHFVCYGMPTESRLPRLTKSILPEILKMGSEVLMNLFCLDFDNPGHEIWTPSLRERFYETLTKASDIYPWVVDNLAFFYMTHHGARLIYILDTPLPVASAEDYHRGMVIALHEVGLLVDESCSDWTRLFRLPRVIRKIGNAKIKTWEQPFFETAENFTALLNPKIIKPSPARLVSGGMDRIEELKWDRPSDHTSAVLLLNAYGKPSEWYRAAKKRMKGREAFACLFEDQPLAEPGERDSTLHRLVGGTVGVLYHLEETTPDLIYALFSSPVLQLEPDEGTPDWMDTLYRTIKKYWEMEDAKERYRKNEIEVKKAHSGSKSAQVLDVVRTWCHHDHLQGKDGDAWAWLGGKLIVRTGNSHHVMKGDGYYSENSCAVSMLPATIRNLQMDDVIPLERVAAGGKTMRTASPQELLNDHAIEVRKVEARGGKSLCFVEDMGTEDAKLILPTYHRRTDLTPEYSEEVDEWTHSLFPSEEDYQKYCNWMSWALRFEDGPTCSLSVMGPQGCGKKIIPLALAECINTGVFAGPEVFGRFNSTLLETPFVVVNEGFPTQSQGMMHRADMFRCLTSGDPIKIERKYQDVITLYSPVRMLFLANNLDVVRELTGGKDLTMEDREALALRMLHLTASRDATELLRSRGGLKYTGRPGRRWVRGDDGSPSDFIVARHLLWLMEQRKPVPRGSRFLVEGDLNAKVMRDLVTRSGSAPEVIEAIVLMIEKGGNIEGLKIIDDPPQIMVSAHAVMEYYRRALARKNLKALSTRTVASVLAGLTVTDKRREGRRHKILDIELLYKEAGDFGYPCMRLERLYEKALRT